MASETPFCSACPDIRPPVAYLPRGRRLLLGTRQRRRTRDRRRGEAYAQIVGASINDSSSALACASVQSVFCWGGRISAFLSFLWQALYPHPFPSSGGLYIAFFRGGSRSGQTVRTGNKWYLSLDGRQIATTTVMPALSFWGALGPEDATLMVSRRRSISSVRPDRAIAGRDKAIKSDWQDRPIGLQLLTSSSDMYFVLLLDDDLSRLGSSILVRSNKTLHAK